MEFRLKNGGFDSFEVKESLESYDEFGPQNIDLRRSNYVRRPTKRYSSPNFHSTFCNDEPGKVKEVVNSKHGKL